MKIPRKIIFLFLFFVSVNLQGLAAEGQGVPGTEPSETEQPPGVPLSPAVNAVEPLEGTSADMVSESGPEQKHEETASKLNQTMDALEFKDTDILTALKILEQKTGITVHPDADIKGVVSFNIQNIHVLDALKILLEPLRLAYLEQDHAVRIMTEEHYLSETGRSFAPIIQTRIVPVRYSNPDEIMTKLSGLKSDSGKIFLSTEPTAIIAIDAPKVLDEIEAFIQTQDIPLETEVFDLKNSLAAEVAENLKKTLNKNFGQIRSDERANKIVVTDTSALIREVGDLIKELDKPKVIQLEAKIVRIELSDAHEQGVDWEAIVSAYSSLRSNGGVEKAGKRDLCIGIVTREDYDVLLDALDLVGDMETFSVSGNSIVNNKMTLLHLVAQGDDVNFSVVSPMKELDQASSPVKPESVDSSFILNPQVHLDETLSLVLNPVTQDVHRQANLQLKPGEIIVIGGIFKEDRVDRTKKFPFFGDLPFVGFVFRSRTKDLRRMEYIVILVPTVTASDATPP